MDKTAPLVTIAMPIFNAGGYLRAAVLSIVRQSYGNWELLLIDDGSTDNALNTISDIEDPRIHIVHDGLNKGLAERLNECIDRANGKYFARMDQDDISYPERLTRQVEALEKDSLLDLLSVRALTIDSDGNAIGLYPFLAEHEEICSKPWIGFSLPHPTWMGKTVWFRKYRYRLPGSYYSEDMDLLLRSYPDSNFGMLPDVLFAYRVRSNIILNKQIKARLAVFFLQWKIFGQRRQWRLACLSMIALMLRVARDVVRLVRQAMNISSRRSERLPDAVVHNWAKVVSQVLDERRSSAG